MKPIIIVGSGLAGYTLLKEIRKRDTVTPVTLVTADDGTFYSKPNLSNALAAGRTAAALAGASAERMASEQNATVMTQTRVTAIDTAAHRIHTDRGELEFSRLVLALGADPIPHGLDGDAAEAVLAVNDLADYALFRSARAGRKRARLGLRQLPASSRPPSAIRQWRCGCKSSLRPQLCSASRKAGLAPR